MLYGAMNSPMRPLFGQIEDIADSTFDYLELTMDAPYCDSGTLRKQKGTIMETLEQSNLKLVCHLPTFLSTADLTDRIRNASIEETLDSLELAAELKSMKVVLHPGYMVGLGVFMPALSREYAMDSLGVFVEKAGELGLCLCLENMFSRGQWLVKPEEFKDVLDTFPDLYLTLDIGHAHVNSPDGEKCLRFIEMFSGRIGHLHVSDNFGKDDQHLPVGEGGIDFPRIVTALKAAGYNGTITLEVFTDSMDDLKRSKKKMEEMFD